MPRISQHLTDSVEFDVLLQRQQQPCGCRDGTQGKQLPTQSCNMWRGFQLDFKGLLVITHAQFRYEGAPDVAKCCQTRASHENSPTCSVTTGEAMMACTGMRSRLCPVWGSVCRMGTHLISSSAWYRLCEKASATHLATMMATSTGSSMRTSLLTCRVKECGLVLDQGRFACSDGRQIGCQALCKRLYGCIPHRRRLAALMLPVRHRI